MRLSKLLDPRRLAALQTDAPEGDGGAAPWAAEDAAALAAQLAALAEMRELAVRMARVAAMERLAAAGVGDDEAEDDDEGAGGLPPSPDRCPRGAGPREGGGAAGDGTASAAPGRGEGGGGPSTAGDGARRGNPELAFQRLNRTLRLTIALEARLRAERARGFAAARASGARGAAARGREDWAAEDEPLLTPEMRAKVNARLMQLVVRKRVIVGVVQDALAARGEDAETLEDLGRLLSERLLDQEASDTVELPIGRMVARICRDLRVSPDWSRWKDCDWALEEAETGAEGSPYGDPVIRPAGWQGGVAIPHPDAGTLERLARGFAPDEDAGEDAEEDAGAGADAGFSSG